MKHGKHRKRQFAIVFSASVLLLSLMAMGTAHASTPTFSNDFETDTAGWFDNSGTITRQPSGYDGNTSVLPYADDVASSSGGFHARLDRGTCFTQMGGGGNTVNCPGPFTRWGGYGATWHGTYTTQVDIYLDAAYAQANADSYGGNIACLTATDPSVDPDCKGTRFDYTSAINKAGDAGPNGHLRDFGFNVSTGLDGDTCDGFTITGQTNVNRIGANPNAGGHDPQCVDVAGWYTFKHTFSDVAGYLNVLMEIIPVGSSSAVASWNITGIDPIETVGCNRYGWFSDQEIFGLPIDNAEMAGGCGKTSPTIATALSASGGIEGDTIHDSATLTGETSDAGGTVNYRYYASPADCASDTTGTAGTDVSTETVTDSAVPNSDDETFTSAGTFYWAAFYSGDARNQPAKSDCASERLEIATQVGKITPTGTTCPQYQGSTAATLGQVRYTTVKGGSIGSVSPGVFFYYTRVSGSTGDTVAITQSHTGSAPAIPIQQKQVLLYSDPGCATLKWKTLTVSSDGTATGTLPSSGTFIVSVKYDTSSLKGKAAPVPPTSTYTFGTNLNGGPILADIARVDLVKK